MNLIERLLDEPFADDIHLVGTSQQTARVTHYANLTMAYIREHLENDNVTDAGTDAVNFYLERSAVFRIFTAMLDQIERTDNATK
jgi:hypothetical protein